MGKKIVEDSGFVYEVDEKTGEILSTETSGIKVSLGDPVIAQNAPGLVRNGTIGKVTQLFYAYKEGHTSDVYQVSFEEGLLPHADLKCKEFKLLPALELYRESATV